MNKFRILKWYHMRDDATWYGIQCKPDGAKRWHHCVREGKAMVYPSKPEAEHQLSLCRGEVPKEPRP